MGVDANIFNMPDGSLLAPMMVQGALPGDSTEVKLKVRLPERMSSDTVVHCNVLQKGRSAKWTLLRDACLVSEGSVSPSVPIDSGIAMLKISSRISETKIV